MRVQYYLVLLISYALFTSCISTKRTKYLQDTDATEDFMVVERIYKPYRLQVNDLISIRIKALDQELVGMFNPIGEANPNITGEERMYYDGFTVDRQGIIRIPTLGEVYVLGLTVEEVREKIEHELLENYYKEEANVFVSVDLAGIRYAIIGEVADPGSRVIYKEQVSIMEAIANAGDITEYGDRQRVEILRQYPGGQQKHQLDLTSIEATQSPYYYIQPNDLIMVQPLPQKAIGLGSSGLGSLTTVVSVLTAVATVFLLFTRL